jgi:hypothetical protein
MLEDKLNSIIIDSINDGYTKKEIRDIFNRLLKIKKKSKKKDICRPVLYISDSTDTE